jgi:hypothetical protein
MTPRGLKPTRPTGTMAVGLPSMRFEAGPGLAVAHLAVQPGFDQRIYLVSELAQPVIPAFKEDEPEGVLMHIEGCGHRQSLRRMHPPIGAAVQEQHGRVFVQPLGPSHRGAAVERGLLSAVDSPG